MLATGSVILTLAALLPVEVNGVSEMGPVRVPPVPVEDFLRIEAQLFGAAARGGTANVTRTWAHSPGLMKAQRPLQDYLFDASSLPARDRELAILRVGWRCGSPYVFGQHRRLGRAIGLRDDEVDRVVDGPASSGWSAWEATLLGAVDELIAHARVGDTTWVRLTAVYRVEQVLDLVATVGRYWTVAVTLNSLGVPLDEGVEGFPT